MTSRGDGHGGSLVVPFLSVFHTNDGEEDDGVSTPEGFQNTPDQWHTAGHRKRGGGDPLATQRDSQATQLATEVQSFDPDATRPESVSWGDGPSFVDATGSLSGDGSSSDRRQEDVDEDETQIIMSLSQDRGPMRTLERHIEEEELEAVVPPPQPLQGDATVTTGEGSDADSDMSDDMLEQDGDINGLSSIAKNFQLSEADLTQEKKPTAHVYKPRMPFQVTPPASVAGEASAEDESSGAETEVDEEPETTQILGTSKVGMSEVPPPLNVSVKAGFLAKRSVSESGATQPEENRPKRYSLDRSVSCSDAEATPERPKRARISLAKPVGDGRPPLPRTKRLRLDSADETSSELATNDNESASRSSSQETNTVAEADVQRTVECPQDTGTTPSRQKLRDKEAVTIHRTSPKPTTTPKSNRNRKVSSQASLADTETVDNDTTSWAPPVLRATPKHNRKRKVSSQASIEATEVIESDTAPSVHESSASDPALRIMFTGLDGTIPKLRDKVKKIADACQEDEDIEKATHLVAPKNQLKRTVKLLCGISCCDHILDERWLDESARSGFPASETLHCLKDTNAEAKWNFSLYHTMYSVPKSNRRKLFDGLRFFITNHKSVLPPVKELVKIVECAGGHAEIKGTATSNDIVITSETALQLAATKKALVHANPDRIYTPEFILSGILQQNVDFGAHRLSPADTSETTSKKKRGRK